MASHQPTKIAHNTRPILVLEQEHDPGRNDLGRLAVNPNNSRIIRRAKESAPSRNHLLATAKRLHMQPFVKSNRFGRTLFFHRNAERGGNAPNVYIIKFFYRSSRKKAHQDRSRDGIDVRQLLSFTTVGDVQSIHW